MGRYGSGLPDLSNTFVLCQRYVCTGSRVRSLPVSSLVGRAVVRFVPPVSGSEVTCELEFTIPEDDRFFDDKVLLRLPSSLVGVLRVPLKWRVLPPCRALIGRQTSCFCMCFLARRRCVNLQCQVLVL